MILLDKSLESVQTFGPPSVLHSVRLLPIMIIIDTRELMLVKVAQEVCWWSPTLHDGASAGGIVG